MGRRGHTRAPEERLQALASAQNRAIECLFLTSERLPKLDYLDANLRLSAAYRGTERLLQALCRAMIAVTVSGKAYGAIVAFLPSPSGAVQEIVPDREYLVWLPQAAVDHLRVLRAPGETFSEVILRLASRGSLAAIMR